MLLRVSCDYTVHTSIKTIAKQLTDYLVNPEGNQAATHEQLPNSRFNRRRPWSCSKPRVGGRQVHCGFRPVFIFLHPPICSNAQSLNALHSFEM